MLQEEQLVKNHTWYKYPLIYDMFSIAEDKENIIASKIIKYINEKRIRVNNPIDLGTGTGKIIDTVLNKIYYCGNIYAVDNSKEMIHFLTNKYKNKKCIQIVQSSIEKLNLDIKSNFIISCFGFPSCVYDKSLIKRELINVNRILDDDGILITIGWNEKYDDELSYIWYKYVDVSQLSYDEWKKEKIKSMQTTRNCSLSWLENDIETKLEVTNKTDGERMFRILFGKKSLDYIISDKNMQLKMKMGITLNTKQEINKIIKEW